MSPSELIRQVAAATGESVAEIRTRGFSLHVHDNTDEQPAARPRRRRRRRRSPSRNGTST